MNNRMKNIIFVFFSLMASSCYAVNWGSIVSTTTIPDCQDSGGNHLNFTATTSSITCGSSGGGGGGSPGGSNSNVQFNNASAFGGDNGFQYDNSVSSVTINGSLGIQKSSASIPSNIHFDPLFPTIVFTAQPIFRQYVNTKDNGVRPSRYSIGVSSYTLAGNDLSENRIDLYPGDGSGGNIPTIFFYAKGNLNYEIDPNAIFTYPPATFYGQIIISSTVIDSNSTSGISGQVFTSNGSSPATWQNLSLGRGSIRQVVNFSSTGSSTTSNTSFVASDLAVTITPQLVGSTIAVTACFSGTMASGGISPNIGIYTLFRGTTNLGDGTNGMAKYSVGVTLSSTGDEPICLNWNDAPNTTSATTYTVNFRSTSGAGTVGVGSGETRFMTAKEIGS